MLCFGCYVLFSSKTLPAVIVRDDMLGGTLSSLDVAVVDVGLSDHHLLMWAVDARQPFQEQPLQTITTRPWRSLDVSNCVLSCSRRRCARSNAGRVTST